LIDHATLMRTSLLHLLSRQVKRSDQREPLSTSEWSYYYYNLKLQYFASIELELQFREKRVAVCRRLQVFMTHISNKIAIFLKRFNVT